MTELSDLITEANRERGLSTRDIEADAARRGFKLSHSTAGKVLKGTHGRVDLTTVLALEAVFGIHRDKITDAANMPRMGGQYDPPREAVFLTPRQRKVLTELILSMTEGGGAGDKRAAPTKTPDSGPVKPLSVVPASVDDAVAALEQEESIAGEQEKSTDSP